MAGSGLFDIGAVAALVDQHESGSFNHTQALWHLLVVEGFLADAAQLAGGSAGAARRVA